MGVVLKPNTQLLVSFELVMRVSDAGLLGSDVTQAGATAYLQTYIPVDPDMPSGGGSMEAESLHTTRDSFAETLERSVTLSSFVSNPLGKELDISLGLNLVSYAGAAPWPDTTPPPVPEPSTYGLLALGLGALGFCRVRRQAAKTPTERT
ncbi:PEP-CTERM sorting domain-containing protein [Eleftheria terrae]|uniref:PEP-CTERM sorting domain-containing protein n=1 Tax=Eleftheria terrae TaxID=1597781 RepID=UPI00263B57FF|nr:PEP-CTERM sorting domain-containing protein [Eleftheria terrae]WKB56157.1 PEP-CTERM sorting domain-containing protein [Eleftheria terrae]